MFNPTKVCPIKQLVMNLGAINGSGVNTGGVIIRLANPTCRLHFTLQIGWSFMPPITDMSNTDGTWSFYPMMKDPLNGGQLIRMQPVVSNGTLPDGYEAESGVVDWEAACTFNSTDIDPGRLFAIVTWQPARGTEMCEDERAYWAGLCNAQVIAPISLGGSS